MSKKANIEKVRLIVFANTYCGKQLVAKIRSLNKIPLEGVSLEELPYKIKRLFPETYKEYINFLDGGGFSYPTTWIIQHSNMLGVDKLVERFNFSSYMFRQMVLYKVFDVTLATHLPLKIRYATPENPITDGYYMKITDEAFALKDLNEMKDLLGIKNKRLDVPKLSGQNEIQIIRAVEDKICEVKRLISEKDSDFEAMYLEVDQDFSTISVMDIVFEQVCGDMKTKYKTGQETKLKNKYHRILSKLNLPNFTDTTALLKLIEH